LRWGELDEDIRVDEAVCGRFPRPRQLATAWFLLHVEPQARPALAEDETVRVFRNLAQRRDVTAVLRAIDGAGELA
jgi:hypothetical protein